MKALRTRENILDGVLIYIYIYAFSRRFYPKRLTLHSSYSFYILSALAFPGVLIIIIMNSLPKLGHMADKLLVL